MIYKTKQERAEEARRIFSNSEFKEEDHPRGEDGKFGKGGGGKKTESKGERGGGEFARGESLKKAISAAEKRGAMSTDPKTDKNKQDLVSRGETNEEKKAIEDAFMKGFHEKAKKETGGESKAPAKAKKENSSNQITVYRATLTNHKKQVKL